MTMTEEIGFRRPLRIRFTGPSAKSIFGRRETTGAGEG
jgi:hypothetical protein